ncbi:MAG: leucine-rich repeat domain-containing protein [Lachnospiraceae bacterium]|nr:leucine-rich repeat domain-containing protein [Lachnospiraceae bacterium]
MRKKFFTSAALAMTIATAAVSIVPASAAESGIIEETSEENLEEEISSNDVSELKVSDNETAECEVSADSVSENNSQIDSNEYSEGNFKFSEENGIWSVTAFTGSDSEVTLPESYDGHTITVVGANIFKSNHNIKKVTIPANYKEIDDSAFFDCQALTEVNLNEGLEKIGRAAFMGTGISSIKLPDSLKEIDKLSFSGNDSLKSVTIPANVTTLGSNCFDICGSLETVTFAGDKNLIYIGGQAFQQDPKLKSIKIPSSVKELGYAAFAYCSSLESADLSSKITDIDTSMFVSCTSLKTVYIPVTVKRINNFAFNDTGALKDIYYAGSKSKWNDIEISDSAKEAFKNVTIHYNSKESESSEGSDSSNPVVETREGFTIGYNSTLPFNGKKVTLSRIGTITISYNGSTYTAAKIRVNKKLKKFQITKLTPADRKAQKLLKKLTKKDLGLSYSITPYTVSNSSDVKATLNKKGDLRRVAVKINDKYYKCKKSVDYDYDSTTKTITFKGDSYTGSYTVSSNS